MSYTYHAWFGYTCEDCIITVLIFYILKTASRLWMCASHKSHSGENITSNYWPYSLVSFHSKKRFPIAMYWNLSTRGWGGGEGGGGGRGLNSTVILTLVVQYWICRHSRKLSEFWKVSKRRLVNISVKQ